MKNKNIEIDYKSILDLKFIYRVGSPFDCDMPRFEPTDIVQPIENKKILVIRLEDLAELYALNNSVTYLTDNEEKIEQIS